MRWSDCAVQDLKKYNGLKASLVNIAERIEALEERLTSVNGVNTSRIPAKGGGLQRDDYLLDNIVERERLKLLHKADSRLADIIEKGLASLDSVERLVLDRFFVSRQKDHVEVLARELHLERSQIYRIKDNALYNFTIIMYGIEEY